MNKEKMQEQYQASKTDLKEKKVLKKIEKIKKKIYGSGSHKRTAVEDIFFS